MYEEYKGVSGFIILTDPDIVYFSFYEILSIISSNGNFLDYCAIKFNIQKSDYSKNIYHCFDC